MTDTCKRCGQPVQLARLPAKGMAPFDPEPENTPTADGYVIRLDPEGNPWAFGGSRERQPGEPTYTFHLAVCPKRFRGSRPKIGQIR